MKSITKRVVALAGVLALGLTAVKAQTDGALLDALVKKGVLSDKEAEDVRASEAKDYSTTAAGKLSIPGYVTNLKIYGDARLRFEYLDETPQAENGGFTSSGTGVVSKVLSHTYSHDNVIERNRYRLRIGADYTFTNNFKAGFELESATAGDSANQSFGNGFSKESLNIGLVYLQYKPVDWLTLVGGKQKNPLYTTNLVWDPDINPEGGSEVMSWTFPFGGSSAPMSKDPKAVAPISKSSDMSLTIGLTGGQFVYSDNSEFNAPGSNISATGTVVSPGTAQSANLAGGNASQHDVWMFVEQVPVQFNINDDMYIKEVPGFISYMNGGNTGLSSSFVNGTGGETSWAGGSTLNFTGPNIADHLQIFTAPGEFDWKLGSIPFKAYWDFALNTDGKARVQDVLLGNGDPVFRAASTTDVIANKAVQAQNQALGDNVAWEAGLQVGQNKKKGDWSIKSDFRQVGAGAVDPNINDSDWGDSFLNQQGIEVSSTYNFTDFLTGTVSYYNTWNYKEHLLDGSSPGENAGNSLPLSGNSVAKAAGTPPAGAAPSQATSTGYSVGGTTTSIAGLVGANTTQRLQVDLMWKF